MKKFIFLIKKYWNMGLIKSFKFIIDSIIRPFIPFIHNVRWKLLSNINSYIGITDKQYVNDLVVSLTSFPARINTVHTSIESLLMQNLKPNKVILWLSNEEFPNKESDLPNNLLNLKNYGLSIKWCENIGSYKKLIPALRELKNSIIITADDDLYYHPKMVERLYFSYIENPYLIHCHRVTKFYKEDNQFKAIAGGYDVYKMPTFLHKLTGGAGTCYPPGCFYKDVCNIELIRKLIPTNDDIWFWVMTSLNGRKCNIIKNSCNALYFVKNSQETALNYNNDSGENLFWKQLSKIFNQYPEFKNLLNQEWNQMCKTL